ncbi:MAG: 2-amino-4-hydroxy-6-hydroxymethyldihydropteridine diphosphokinase [Methylotenera sp.]|jgi:2-amino-4-hydroxy-6-hydroxymethyldihydropteridine diphosphokinase|uniref:2-amino-4-hydroxy-6- hydroxymethyldihydropteridine diphosphokinase n=1 Tax=Methylotenera sp. TaxID=2051956 RepID=UPI00271D1C8B|nr:2-amino-4-hydroxy-6-hydroxymethyldihydropteridine diphosphokinase [Methylotenera sp.]MDO9150460.1 2-amino-4-hydroxy-6-hydroxymethyldihydropteridine diphosphokinase [Methylotenera sp.]
MMKQAFVALGSNLENPKAQVEQAVIALSHLPETRLVKQSSLYQTAPIDCIETAPDFINAVAELETSLAPEALLDAILNIENHAGRERPYLNAPRVLDCDLLLYEDVTLNTTKLTLPHPRMHLRGFVLLPLFEIAPDISIPNHGKIATFMTSDLLSGIKKLPSLS